jgi:hypothetical protein
MLPHGGGSFFRAGTTWPAGHGGLTLNFVAVTGVPGVKGSVKVSDQITAHTRPDPGCDWGIKDDGTYESAWTSSIPAGPSDYFSTWFKTDCSPNISEVIDFELAVVDFGTTATAFPTSGVFGANYSIDPSGGTPDLSLGWAVAPLTFPPGSFVSTSGQLVVRTFDNPIPYDTFPSDDIHGVIQFPPGDPGLLACGADITPSPGITWASTSTHDGYQTPAWYSDLLGWGLRLGAR